MSEIITLDATHRLVVKPDEDAQCPREDWHMLTGFVKVGGRGDWRLRDVPAVYDDTLGIDDAHERFSGRAGYVQRDRLGNPVRRQGSYELTEETTVRWARIFHNAAVVYDSEHGGYWWAPLEGDEQFAANWPDLTPGTPEHYAKQLEVIEQEQKIYQQWVEGEIYGVILQRATYLYELDDMGIATDRPALEVWDHLDSVWGNYLDDQYTALDVAKENFDLEGIELQD